ncbi:hypothetical protein EMCRGX_G023308 [Ephydatia muelleri]
MDVRIAQVVVIVAYLCWAAAANPTVVAHDRKCARDKPYSDECPFEPCTMAKCSNFPKAKCINDYCGGCGYQYVLNGKNVTEKCDPCAYVKCPTQTVCNFDGRYVAYCARQCTAHKDCQTGYFCKPKKAAYPLARCIEGTCGYFANGYCLKMEKPE